MSATQFLHGAELLEVTSGKRNIKTVNSSVIGVVGTAPNSDRTKFPYNKPVLITSSSEAAKLRDSLGADGGGTLPEALDRIYDQAGAVVVVVVVEQETDAAATLANVIGSSSAGTGVYALKKAQSVVGYKPRILLAPGFTSDLLPDTTNPGHVLPNQVVSALDSIAGALRAVVIADGPGTDEADAINAGLLYGSERIYMVDCSGVQVTNAAGAVVIQPVSSCVAGVIARTDNELGFWWSPSNKSIKNILGTGRPIDFADGDATCRATILNENNISTVVRGSSGGFQLWGNHTLSADQKWTFLSVRRTADMINDSVLRAHTWAVDRNIDKTYLKDVVEGIKAYLRYLKNLGAIIDGDAWADPDLNSPDQISQGRVYFDFDFAPPYPAEHIIFRSALNNDYLTEVL